MHFFLKKDPNVKDWPLMQSILPTIYLSLFYVSLVKIVSFIMKYFKEFNLKFPNLIYNVASMLLNVYICSKIIVIKYKARDFGLCTRIQATGTDFSDEVCLDFMLISYH